MTEVKKAGLQTLGAGAKVSFEVVRSERNGRPNAADIKIRP